MSEVVRGLKQCIRQCCVWEIPEAARPFLHTPALAHCLRPTHDWLTQLQAAAPPNGPVACEMVRLLVLTPTWLVSFRRHGRTRALRVCKGMGRCQLLGSRRLRSMSSDAPTSLGTSRREFMLCLGTLLITSQWLIGSVSSMEELIGEMD